MPIKLVYVMIVALVLLILTVFFLLGVDRTGAKVGDTLGGFLEGGVGSLQCTFGTSGNECSGISDEASCKAKDGGRACLWCTGEVNGQKVSTCQSRVCGCGSFRSTNVIELGDMGELYYPGDSILVTGKVVRHGQVIKDGKVIDAGGSLKGLEIKYSFLDRNKAETKALGPGGTVTTDEDGTFEIEHKIPEGAPKTRYHILVEFADTSDWEDFEVG